MKGHSLRVVACVVGLSWVLVACQDIQGPVEFEAAIGGDAVGTDASGIDALSAEQLMEAGFSTNDSACRSGIVSTGFGLRWQNEAHRVSRWGFLPDTRCVDSLWDTFLSVQASGGDFANGEQDTDIPHFTYDYSLVPAPLKQSVGEGLRFGHVDVDFELDAVDEMYVAQEIDLAEIGLQGVERVALVLQGLMFNTGVQQPGADFDIDYDPSHGFTSRGIGAWVRYPEIIDDTLHFFAGVRFALGPLDREDMNLAMEFLRVEAQLRVLVVGLPMGASASTGDIEYRLDYDKPAVFTQVELAHATAEQRTLDIYGKPGHDHSLAALSGFEFQLNPDDPERHGYYIREFAVRLLNFSVPNAQGIASVEVDGYASDQSTFTYQAMSNLFSASVTLLQWDANDGPLSHSVAGETQLGEEIHQISIYGL